MESSAVARVGAGAVVLATVVAPWNGLDHALATRFLPVAVGLGAGAPCLYALARRGDEGGQDGGADRWAVRLGVAFIAWLAVCAAFADRPLLSALGLYGWGTGAMFSASLVCTWALGRVSGERTRLVEDALLVAMLLNAGFALLQAFGLQPLGVAPADGRAPGLLRNPVYLAALLGGGWWIVTHRFHQARAFPDARQWWWPAAAAAVAGAIQASGSRSVLALVALAVIASIAVIGWRSAALLGAAGVAGIVAVSLLAPAQAPVSGTARLASGGGLASRVDNWSGGLRSLAASPIVGVGPGRWRAATTPYRTRREAREFGPDAVYSDAHNLVVEYAVTAGVPGVFLLVAFLVLVILRAGWRSPLAGFGLLVLGAHLLEPQTTFVTPLAFLALGAAATPGPVRVPARALAASGAAALAAWGIIAAGSWALFKPGATVEASLSKLHTASSLLAPWEDAPERAGSVDHKLFGLRHPEFGPPALAEFQLAAAREPDDVAAWVNVARVQRELGDLAAAQRSVDQALRVNPQSVAARIEAALVATRRGDRTAAAAIYRQALDISPDDPAATEGLKAVTIVGPLPG